MAFDPNDHLITLQGKKYLEIKFRLVWLREAFPDAVIVTELVEHNVTDRWCIFKATVTLPTGGSATGYARQEPTTIAKDYIANGETSAIGRALAGLGFGTQHATELDQGDQVVDSPVQPRQQVNLATHGRQYEQQKGRETPPAPQATVVSSVVYPPKPVTASAEQRESFIKTMQGIGFHSKQCEEAVNDVTGNPITMATRDDLVRVYKLAQDGLLYQADGRWQARVPGDVIGGDAK